MRARVQTSHLLLGYDVDHNQAVIARGSIVAVVLLDIGESLCAY